jgi:hypothetical protein
VRDSQADSLIPYEDRYKAMLAAVRDMSFQSKSGSRRRDLNYRSASCITVDNYWETQADIMGKGRRTRAYERLCKFDAARPSRQHQEQRRVLG